MRPICFNSLTDDELCWFIRFAMCIRLWLTGVFRQTRTFQNHSLWLDASTKFSKAIKLNLLNSYRSSTVEFITSFHFNFLFSGRKPLPTVVVDFRSWSIFARSQISGFHTFACQLHRHLHSCLPRMTVCIWSLYLSGVEFRCSEKLWSVLDVKLIWSVSSVIIGSDKSNFMVNLDLFI